jgi:hypothetical protein
MPTKRIIQQPSVTQASLFGIFIPRSFAPKGHNNRLRFLRQPQIAMCYKSPSVLSFTLRPLMTLGRQSCPSRDYPLRAINLICCTRPRSCHDATINLNARTKLTAKIVPKVFGTLRSGTRQIRPFGFVISLACVHVGVSLAVAGATSDNTLPRHSFLPGPVNEITQSRKEDQQR